MGGLRAIPPRGGIPRGQKAKRSLRYFHTGGSAPQKINNPKERAITFRILKEITNEMEEIEEAIEQGIPHNEKYLGMLRIRVQRLKQELRIKEK